MNKLNRFNWIARSYDNLVRVVFGDVLHRAQMHFVNEINEADKVLIIGGGSGKFLHNLLKMKSGIDVVYVEASSEMIALARQQVADVGRVCFIHGTEDDIPSQPFDVVITNFFLDLFTEDQIYPVIKKISRNLRVNGKWLMTDFENTKEVSHRVVLSLMYQFFRITGSIDAKRLAKWRPVFVIEKLRLEEQEFFRNGFVTTSVFVKEPD